MKSATYALALANLAAVISAHGTITSPTPRAAGSAMATACGQQVYDMRSSDDAGNIQTELQVIDSSYDATACHIWMCSGNQFADVDAANIQSYTGGQVVPISFDIRAPHTGVANVSIIDTATNTAIGDPLISWSTFASTATPIQADQESFSITIPSDLGDQCSTAGSCIIQHYWNAASIDQTYESCIDFTVSGSSSSSSSSVAASSSVASSTVAPASTLASSSVAAESTFPTSSVVIATTSVAAVVSTSVTPVTSATISSVVAPLSANSTSTKTKCSGKPTSTASSSVSSDVGVASTSAATALTTTTAAVTTETLIPVASTTSAAAASTTATSTSTTGDGSSSVEELIDLIMSLLEELLGVSSTSSKMKRSHARDLRTSS